MTYRIVFVEDIEFGAVLHPFFAPNESSARVVAEDEIRKLKKMHSKDIFIRHLQRVERVGRGEEKVVNIPFGRYRVLIQWVMKDDSLTSLWEFVADNDEEAISKASQRVRDLNRQVKEKAERKGENPDGTASVLRLDRIDGTKLIEQDIVTVIDLTRNS